MSRDIRNRRDREIAFNLNTEKLIKSHPLYIYMTAIVLGVSTAFGIMAYAKSFLNLEVEKKGTYVYYSEYFNNINNNFVQKELFQNVLAENSDLRKLVDKYRSRSSDNVLVAIQKLKEERDSKTKELIGYTSSMFMAMDGHPKPINTETEKYKELKAELDQINSSIATLYEKL